MRWCPLCLTSFPNDAQVFCSVDGMETVATEAIARQRSLMGRTVGSYEVRKVLGRGGMGEIYLAEHPTIARRVAIKVLAPHCAQSAIVVERFFAEARSVNVIRHENIVEVLDLAFFDDGRPYLVMELLEGESLAGHLEARAPVPLGEVGPICVPVLDALQAAHEASVVRNLKPDNIFLSQRRKRVVPKVLDFGIAKLLNPAVKGGGVPKALTATGAVWGTPMYMAPEQAAGRHREIDARSDIYSMGIILYELVCGQPPFQSDSFGDILVAHLTLQPRPPRSVSADIPETLEAVILKALEKERDARFQSADEMSKALVAALRGAGVVETPIVISSGGTPDSIATGETSAAPASNPSAQVSAAAAKAAANVALATGETFAADTGHPLTIPESGGTEQPEAPPLISTAETRLGVADHTASLAPAQAPLPGPKPRVATEAGAASEVVTARPVDGGSRKATGMLVAAGVVVALAVPGAWIAFSGDEEAGASGRPSVAEEVEDTETDERGDLPEAEDEAHEEDTPATAATSDDVTEEVATDEVGEHIDDIDAGSAEATDEVDPTEERDGKKGKKGKKGKRDKKGKAVTADKTMTSTSAPKATGPGPVTPEMLKAMRDKTGTAAPKKYSGPATSSVGTLKPK